MVLTRTLRRKFLLHGPLPDDCIAFLYANPLVPEPTVQTDEIKIDARSDGLLTMRCSWGRTLTGSARVLTRTLDESIYRLAICDEGSSLNLNASIVRFHETRIVLVAAAGVNLGELIVALILAGAAFEGAGPVFVRAGGLIAHPAKPRLRASRLASVGLSSLHGLTPALDIGLSTESVAIDPMMIGVEWSVIEGPSRCFVFVESNEGGRSALKRLRFECAFARLMRSVRSVQRPEVSAFVRLRAMIDGAISFRVSMGDPVATAGLIVAQLPHISVDE